MREVHDGVRERDVALAVAVRRDAGRDLTRAHAERVRVRREARTRAHQNLGRHVRQRAHHVLLLETPLGLPRSTGASSSSNSARRAPSRRRRASRSGAQPRFCPRRPPRSTPRSAASSAAPPPTRPNRSRTAWLSTARPAAVGGLDAVAVHVPARVHERQRARHLTQEHQHRGPRGATPISCTSDATEPFSWYGNTRKYSGGLACAASRGRMWSCVSSSISRSSTWYRSMSAFVGSFGRFTATGAPLNRPKNTAEAGPSWILVRPVANADFGAAKGTEVDVRTRRARGRRVRVVRRGTGVHRARSRDVHRGRAPSPGASLSAAASNWRSTTRRRVLFRTKSAFGRDGAGPRSRPLGHTRSDGVSPLLRRPSH